MTPPQPSSSRIARADVALAAFAFGLVASITWGASGFVDARLLEHQTVDVWFEADIARVVENMSERWSDHYRAQVHPILALVVLPFVYAVRRVLSLETWTSIRVVLSLTAGLWAIGLFAVLRLTGFRRPDASVFTLLGVTSAGAVFWFGVPETHIVGSLTILLALLVVAVSARRQIPAFVEVAVGVATLGVTVTNWMAGIIASWSHRSWRQTLQISANAFALTVLLWAVGKKLAPSSTFFLGNPPEPAALLSPEALGPARVVSSFLMHTVVMPAIAIVDRPGAGQWPILAVQPSSPGSGGALSLLSAVLWGALLLVGVWSLWRVREHRSMRLFVACFLAGQLALHLLYGSETFLYAPNYLPALIVLSAFGAMGPLRRVVVPVALLLVVTNAINNGSQWWRATRFLADNARYQHDPRAARAERPEDPWPDAAHFTPISEPGARVVDQVYVSAGGSFSPGMDQFTISLWARDEDGRILANSDETLPSPSDTTQRVVERGGPWGRVQTAYYDVHWQPDGLRKYRMQLTTRNDARVSLVVRGIGARAAPVRYLHWDGSRLTINRRWVIEGDSATIMTFLGDEQSREWQGACQAQCEIDVPDGWAAARLELSAHGRHALVVRDLEPARSIDRPLGVIPAIDHSSGKPR
jgi:hypothetical protein